MADLTFEGQNSGQAEGAKTAPSGADRMDISVERFSFGETTTLGRLYIHGEFVCWTLEDKVRDLGPHGEGKVWGQTAIPEGRYRVIINLSQRFGRFMMRLLDVPHFTGILIHGGNTDEDTHGCILVGNELDGDMIKAGTSTPAVKELFRRVRDAIDAGLEVWLTIG